MEKIYESHPVMWLYISGWTAIPLGVGLIVYILKNRPDMVGLVMSGIIFIFFSFAVYFSLFQEKFTIYNSGISIKNRTKITKVNWEEIQRVNASVDLNLENEGTMSRMLVRFRTIQGKDLLVTAPLADYDRIRELTYKYLADKNVEINFPANDIAAKEDMNASTKIIVWFTFAGLLVCAAILYFASR